MRRALDEAAMRRLVLTRSDARAAGVADSTLTNAARRLGWERRYPGVWLPQAPPGPDHVRDMIAAIAWVGGQAVVGGASALWLAGVLPRAPEAVELLVPAGRNIVHRKGVCVHYTSRFSTLRTRTIHGIPALRMPEAIADHSRHASARELVFVIADASRLRQVTLQQVLREIAARPRFPGRGRLRQAFEELTGELTHSRYERLGRQLLRDGGLVFHPRPYTVEHGGVKLAEIDIPFVPLRYGVEIDGPPHLLPEVAARDRIRDRRLARVHWTIDRYLWTELLDRPAAFVAEVTRRVRALGG